MTYVDYRQCSLSVQSKTTRCTCLSTKKMFHSQFTKQERTHTSFKLSYLSLSFLNKLQLSCRNCRCYTLRAMDLKAIREWSNKLLKNMSNTYFNSLLYIFCAIIVLRSKNWGRIKSYQRLFLTSENPNPMFIIINITWIRGFCFYDMSRYMINLVKKDIWLTQRVSNTPIYDKSGFNK